MITPQTYTLALLVCLCGILGWGFWAATIRMGGPKWRFELYYFDFSIGALLLTTLVAFTLGSMGSDITFMDNLAIIRKQQIGVAMLAGGVINLGNILLTAAIVLMGMSAAFPVAMGLALPIALLSGSLGDTGSRGVLWAAIALMLAAAALAARAFKHFHEQKEIAQLQKASAAGGKQKPAPRPSPWKGVALAAVGGLFVGGAFPLMNLARVGDIEMAPYPIAFFMTLGLFLTTFVYNIFLTNLPVEGAPISVFRYFKGTLKQHGAGIVGGAAWAVGLVAVLTIAALPPSAALSPALRISLPPLATLLAAFCGLLAWGEFRDAGDRAAVLIRLSLFVFLLGASVAAVAGLLG